MLKFWPLNYLTKKRFQCPICLYKGPFQDIDAATGTRKFARCPECGCLERHRLQYLVMRLVLDKAPVSQMSMLHVAPESFLKAFFSQIFAVYETADLHMEGVDYKVDLLDLPFSDATYDVVFASHVLEHIANDKKAIQEIRRILKPGGIAVLPVPVVARKTVEYAEPNANEHFHVRAPGLDYFNRYELFFSRVEKFRSDSLPEKYQLYVHEDRSKWESPAGLLSPAEEKHSDIVPVCYV